MFENFEIAPTSLGQIQNFQKCTQAIYLTKLPSPNIAEENSDDNSLLFSSRRGAGMQGFP